MPEPLREPVPLREAPPPAPAPREPEKLRLPAAAVEHLVRLGLRTELGAQWWDGFQTAHGRPGWLAPGAWRLAVPDAALTPQRADPAEEEG